MRRRFFVERFEEGRAVMRGEAAHHVGTVLRAAAGQMYELSDGERVWLARIEGVGKERVEFALVEEMEAQQAAVEVTLLLAVVKFDAFEWAIEKATELGVSRITPVAAARSEKGLLMAAGKRSERWRKILLEASQQSRRVRVPVLGEVEKAEPAFGNAQGEIRLMLSERREARNLREALEGRNVRTCAVAIGPEGGWTEEEFGVARAKGFEEVSLGKMILRTETAVAAALANVNYGLSGEKN